VVSARLHIDEIERVGLGHASPGDGTAVWMRRLNDHRTDPSQAGGENGLRPPSLAVSGLALD